ncbi:hypothetical protein CRE_15483 [Caenorhabditis remanei]|uniref:Uncharacterized protein n=1 Tax=Caenorhabditis remanei TaxID=31234 RepID=E3MSV7_CAERE|nr:hypothetical protein CRE_15483 [Caenorhabditis remanei]
MYSILRILAALCFIGVVDSYLPSEYRGKSPESSIEESNWVDEKEIRERLSAIAAEEFSHHYREHQVRRIQS